MPADPAIQKLSQARPPQWRGQAGDCISDLHFAPHGHTLMVASLNGDLLCIDVKTGQMRWKAEAHPMGVLQVVSHPDQAIVASGGLGGAVKFWGANKGTLLVELELNKRLWVEHMAWSKDGSMLAASCGRHVYFLNAQGELLGKTVEHGHTVLGLGWHPSKLELFTVTKGGAWLFQPSNLEPIEKVPMEGAGMVVVFSPDGKFVAVGNQNQSMIAWAHHTTDYLRMAGYAAKVRELAWNCDSTRLVTGGGFNVIAWDFRGRGPSGSTPEEFAAHSDLITAVAAHPKKPQLWASTGKDQLLFLWESGEVNPIWLRALPESPANRLVWSPSGDALAAGCENGGLCYWKVAPGA